MSPKDCLLAFLPFFHAYGLVALLGLGLHSGAKLVTIPRFEAEAFLRFIEEYKVSEQFHGR
jgi:acyl-CoA synthetase (AMP-forming)/AMP-acid ligase II